MKSDSVWQSQSVLGFHFCLCVVHFLIWHLQEPLTVSSPMSSLLPSWPPCSEQFYLTTGLKTTEKGDGVQKLTKHKIIFSPLSWLSRIFVSQLRKAPWFIIWFIHYENSNICYLILLYDLLYDMENANPLKVKKKLPSRSYINISTKVFNRIPQCQI